MAEQPDVGPTPESREERRAVIDQLEGGEPLSVGGPSDRRCRIERRQSGLWSVAYGTFRPRRRGFRRHDDPVMLTDWYDSLLLLPVLGILILSMMDGVLTLSLLAAGGRELNILMAWLISTDPARFATVKMTLTCTGVIVLVACARLPLIGIFRVVHLLYAFLAAYLTLIGYELFLLSVIF